MINTDEIKTQLQSIEEAIVKMRELLLDIDSCSSDTSKTILFAAVKKYASPIVEFKI